jgi:hypothetical protein
MEVEYGPVDVVVVAMGEPRFDGSLMAELERLAATGTIRVLDAMVLINAENGEQWTLDIEDMPREDQDALGFIDTGTRGLFDGEDAAMMLEGMVPGSAVVALAIENAWAVPFVNALADAGAELALHSRIPAPIVDDALAGLASGAE